MLPRVRPLPAPRPGLGLRRRPALPFVAIALVLASAISAKASTGAGGASGAAAAAAKLPPARGVDDILRDVVKALGGAEAMAKHRSLHTKMTITFQGLGITGTAEHFGAAGDRALTITTIPSVASTREGSDGARSWSQDPINGLRVLADAEAEQARIEAAWNAELRMKDLFVSIEAKNEPADGGASDAYLECLVLTARLSPPLTDCFDAKTHLLARQRGVRASPQGNTPFVARVKDWRTLGDVRMPYVTEMQVGPLSFVGTVTFAELDVPVAPSLFALPEVPTAAAAGGDRGGAATGGAGGTPTGKSKAAAGKAAAKPETTKARPSKVPPTPKGGAAAAPP